MDRDHNAARNILSRGLGTVGHTGTFALDFGVTLRQAQGGDAVVEPVETQSNDASNAWGDETSTLVGANLQEQVMS